MPSFAVITPTIGSPYLKQCVESLKNQDCTHYIVMDGKECFSKVQSILHSLDDETTKNQRLITLEENVGRGWYGHRVYAASSFLVNEDYLCYLDEDNWVTTNYIQSFKNIINTHQWVYTLRNIVDIDGSFVCKDNCESLGKWSVVGESSRFHIDTGCFAIPRSLAVRVGHTWYGQWGADRQFFSALKSVAPNFQCTGEYTLNYRLGGPLSKVTKEMFLRGNELAATTYGGNYPWCGHSQPVEKGRTVIYNTITNQFS